MPGWFPHHGNEDPRLQNEFQEFRTAIGIHDVRQMGKLTM